MPSHIPSLIDLNAELARLTMFRRTPQSTAAERKGSVAQLASYRDGLLLAIKAAGRDHWERHLAGDELVHILGGSATLEIVCDDGPPQSFALNAGMMAVIPQGAWHRLLSAEGATQVAVTPFPGEHVELDVDDPRTVPGAAATAPKRHVAIKLRGSETGGSLMMFEQTMPPGTKSTLHLHQGSDEAAYILSGELTCLIGDDVVVRGPGESAFLPRGVRHAWKCTGGETARVLFLYTPAKAGGLIEEQQRTGRGFGSMSEGELADILERHGWALLGSNPL